MRKQFIAGNWKMNKTVDEAYDLAIELITGLRAVRETEVALCPPFVALTSVKAAIANTMIKLGAQNMHDQDKGAFTGEVSPVMLAGLADYVILGHSERRQHFGESDAFINRKVLAALRHGLRPILCIGETLEQNERGETEAVLVRQVRADLAGVAAEQAPQIVIAYEPVWAIGTGRAATADDAQHRCAFVRAQLRELFGAAADEMRIQYGGSVTPANAREILSQPDVDGALVGGASLKADDFIAIVQAAKGNL
ncbi:MAG: triose-phosphate isomerase [Thermoflexales bacterium]|nr:triose-phosphate isomerase [Thermoflexales bacterium]MDW8350888.1 triose-phosphate isomerase [Anaerolineae bacterium]